MDYLLSLRLKHAKILLSNSNYSITEISQMVGYFNPASFIRIFKKYEGMPPGQYRAEHTVKALDINQLY
jgi:YesN/AraC family two-component response regulator